MTCERCKRHHSIREEACPFCRHGSALGRFGAAALSAGVLLGGCDAGKDNKAAQGSATVEKHPYATLHGTVKDREGKPVHSTILTINSTEDSTGVRSFSRSVPTDGTGRYVLDFLPPGPYSLGVSYNQSNGPMGLTGEVQRQVVLGAGEDKLLDFEVEVRQMDVAPPYGAPPARRRVV